MRGGRWWEVVEAAEVVAVLHGEVERAEEGEVGLSAVGVAAEHELPGERLEELDAVGVVLETNHGVFGSEVGEGGGGVGASGPHFVEADDR